MTVTLASLRSQIRDRVDMKYSSFVSDTELNSYINLSLTELYDLLVSSFEDYYVAAPYQFSLSGTSIIALPADFYKLVGLDYKVDTSTSDQYITLRRFNMADRNKQNNVYTRYALGVPDIRYKILGDSLHVIPADRADGDYQMWYVPRGTLLTTDASTFDGINGWEEYIIVDCAIKCLAKEESDASIFINAKANIKKRIEEMSQNRDAGEPATISDVKYSSIADFGLPYMR